MIRVVAFDFDGTLVDSNSVKASCLRNTVAEFERGSEALKAALALGGDRYQIFGEVARWLDPQGTPSDIAARARTLVTAYSECCARGIMAARERRGGRKVLAQLRRRGLRVWIASATPTRDLLPILRARGLHGLLDGALGGPASKVANLRTILQAERASPRQMLFVGDSPEDQLAARQLGVWFVAITAERRLDGQHRFAMRDLTKLMALVERLRSRPRALSWIRA